MSKVQSKFILHEKKSFLITCAKKIKQNVLVDLSFIVFK